LATTLLSIDFVTLIVRVVNDTLKCSLLFR